MKRYFLSILFSLLIAAPAFGATVTISTDSLYDFYQRDNADLSSVAITVSGTYTEDPAPTSIMVQVVDSVTEAAEMTAVTLDAAPTGGTFTGTFNPPLGGKYKTKVYFSNSTGVADVGSAIYEVGATWMLAGQSLSYYMSIWGDGATPSSNTGQWDFSTEDWIAVTGAEINFCNALADAGIPVRIIYRGNAGSGLLRECHVSFWLDELPDYPSTLYADAVFLANQASEQTGGIEGVYWLQGQTEAACAGCTAGEYKTGLQALITNFRADVTCPNGTLKFILNEMGRSTGIHYYMERIREDERQVAAEDANVYIDTAYDSTLVDTIHPDNTSLVKFAKRAAQIILYIDGLGDFGVGARILGYTAPASTTTDVLIGYDGINAAGDDFTPSSGITGFVVADDGTPESISGAEHINATTIRLTHGAVSGVRTVSYMAGQNPTVTDPVYGNATYASTLYMPLVGDHDIDEIPVASDAFVMSDSAIGGFQVSVSAADAFTISDEVNETSPDIFPEAADAFLVSDEATSSSYTYIVVLRPYTGRMYPLGLYGLSGGNNNTLLFY